MFIGLCGGICAGKHSVEKFLVQKHGFTRLRLTAAESVTRPLLTPSDETTRTFDCFEDLYNFVTLNFSENWVTTEVFTEQDLDQLFLRPFFLLISVDAPFALRWQRYQDRCKDLRLEQLPLQEFISKSDDDMFSPKDGRARVLDRAQVRLVNTSPSLNRLHLALEKLDLLNEERLRPSWDQYFMQLASLAAQRSNCMKRRVGCVLVRDRRVVSTGYNGTPRGLKNCNDGGCARCNTGPGRGHGLSTCLCLHAEENALLEAGRERIREGTSLYCDTCPCLTCSIKITQVGITEVIYHHGYNMDSETAEIFRNGGVKFRQFSPARACTALTPVDPAVVDACGVHISCRGEVIDRRYDTFWYAAHKWLANGYFSFGCYYPLSCL